jgi:hypothetical protein
MPGGGNYGQNIGKGYTANEVPIMIGNDMYNGEINNYRGPYGSDNPDLSNFADVGHYTQIVWAATTQVGCATQTCPDSSPFTVCDYSPPGKLRSEAQS